MFCGLRFNCCFLLDFFIFVMPSGALFGNMFRKKKRSGNRFKKREASIRKWGTTVVSGGSQRRRLACALSEQETITRARMVAGILVRGSGCEKLFGNGCLSWFRLQIFEKTEKLFGTIEKRKGPIPKAHFWWSDTTWAKARRTWSDILFKPKVQCVAESGPEGALLVLF